MLKEINMFIDDNDCYEIAKYVLELTKNTRIIYKIEKLAIKTANFERLPIS